MRLDFFEGPAGTGKTHNLIGRASELVDTGVLGDDRKVLALTFMNGARRRLETTLSVERVFRRRFECQTFDVFARTITARRRSLLRGNATVAERALGLNEFDRPCLLAASLLQDESVQQWVALTFPLVLVDEAQDLDEHRLRILQGLKHFSDIVVAADAFQCLVDGRETTSVIEWLESVGETHRLSEPWRTQQKGLLAAALAVREGRDIKTVLQRSERAQRPTWNAQGFRLVESFATNPGIVARTIADEISHRTGPVAIVSPDMSSALVREALDNVHSRTWQRRGLRFGPFSLTVERGHVDQANALLKSITLPDTAPCSDLCSILAPLTEHPAVAHAISQMDRIRRVQGQLNFSAAQVEELVLNAVRNQSRLGLKPLRGHLAMTIHRAKNREFQNVIVLWPHSATGSQDHLRRLLYNAITRAKSHCTVIVLGQGRLNSPPFAP